jgi:hypothetical protein
MSTQFTNRQWRLPNNENKDKQSNYSLDFNGGNYINAGTLSVTGDWSVSLWVNSNSTSYQSPIQLSSQQTDSTIFLYFYPGGASAKWGFYDGATALTGLTALNTGQWYHLVVTKSGTTYTLFLNGTQESQGTLANINIDDFLIGRRNYNNFYMDGKIDGVSIFDYALSSSQITTLYGSSSTGIGNPMSLSPAPVAYYPLGDQDAFNGANYLVPNIAAQEDDGDIAVSYSPYALDFDGANDSIDIDSIGSTISAMTQISVSAWVKTSSSSFGYILFAGRGGSGRTGYIGIAISSGTIYAVVGGQPSVSGFSELTTTATVNDGNWHHLAMTFNNSNGVIQVYIDGFLDPTSSSTSGLIPTNIIYADIAQRAYNNDFNFDGSISNLSFWNTALTSSQVSEIYNEGVPSNLNNHSAYSNLVSWWQLGSNTSWVDPYWIALDEKGTNNGQSQNVAAPNNMGENAIVDGVGSYANGLSAFMGGDEVIGDAPYSSSNSLSVNMDVLDRTEDTPS